MKIYFLSENRLSELLRTLNRHGRVFHTRERELKSNRENRTEIRIEEYNADDVGDYKVPGFRSYEIFKPFLLPLRSKVAEYPSDEWKDIEIGDEKTILFGLKGCDLAGVFMLDKVFLEDPEFIDPFYKKRRDSLILVSSDCTRTGESCFCNLIGNTPYATSGFDLNLSKVSSGYLIEADSEKGEEILEELSLSEATEEKIKERDETRKKILEMLKEQNSEFEEGFSNLKERVSKGFDSEDGWVFGSTCVSCGACTNVCPVCYCFTLFDRSVSGEEKSSRFMTWDSCQFKGFSQMAGGMNPRFPMMERFKNRYYHKFFRFKERYEEYKCTGCGRCIDNCLGDIDMREVLAGIKITEGES